MNLRKSMIPKAMFVSVCLLPALALADLKPDILDCDPKKAARNAAMDATIGVSGKCDGQKVAENAKEDAKDRIDDKKDDIADKKESLGDKKEDLMDSKKHSKDHDEKKLFKD
ncbi:hypothetical protein KOI40_01250 [Aestuariicella sp. G3-2]|uniref:hypothetical protein n=1 Tax=Pseudomaricurvus albidus TaxID=2842452 RepID=UPI001C0BBE45|nr:hypothetical protein [Aestuariicella albida]MBU3068421.1 hypothetical protein [Aestuariicella albida]